jgi:RNA polymerase sigma factor (sigma-70 family)
MVTNREAVPAAVEPEPPALRLAFEQHYQALVRLSYALCGRVDLAEDIVQDAFVRSAKKLGELSPEEARGYLARCVVNGWRSRLRRMVVERTHASALAPRDWTEESNTDERDALWSALLRLPNRQRACIALRYYEDQPYNRIAEALGCSEGAVKKHIARGLNRLREEVTE